MPARKGDRATPEPGTDGFQFDPGPLLPAHDGAELSFDSFVAAMSERRFSAIAKALGGRDARVSIARCLWRFHLDCRRQIEHRRLLGRASELAAQLAHVADEIALFDDPITRAVLDPFAAISEFPGLPTRDLRRSGIRWLGILDEYADRAGWLYEKKHDGRPSHAPFERLLDGLAEMYVAVTGLSPLKNREYERFLRAVVGLLEELASSVQSLTGKFPSKERYKRHFNAALKRYGDRRRAVEKAP